MGAWNLSDGGTIVEVGQSYYSGIQSTETVLVAAVGNINGVFVNACVVPSLTSGQSISLKAGGEVFWAQNHDFTGALNMDRAFFIPPGIEFSVKGFSGVSVFINYRLG
ncbi:MAG: hypothetical protein JKY94_01930 [Rhodobacteraceae bacterium]|nr:hypothetical protein [Paracoccaceae bacterium]